MKVVSVLTYPFSNRLVVRVTRAPDYFSHPQVTREYSMSYGDRRIVSFSHWVAKLSALSTEKLVKSLRVQYIKNMRI